MQPAVNVALWQNHVPVLTALSITVEDPRAAGDIIVELACEPSVIRPRLWVLQSVTENETRVLSDLDVALDGKILDALTESTRAVVTFTVRRRGLADGALGEKLGERHLDLRMLARNEWGGPGGIPDILAAFVEPNDPAIAKLLRLTSDQLRAAGKTDGLEGYQATSKARLWEQVEALWRAVASLDIRYVNPPASFEVVGQRIRPPREVLSEKLATCLDLAVLVSSAIEAIGMRPVIVLIKDHAFAGVWLTRHDFGSSIVDDAPGLRTRLALDDLMLFETTLVCGRGRAGLRSACETGKSHLAADKDDAFQSVIDVQRARQRRIRPLSSSDTGYALKSDAAMEAEASVDLPFEEPPPLRDDLDIENEPVPTTPEGRLERWRKRLLDLSGRNRLLNLPAGGKQELVIDCPDAPLLENMLAEMRGGPKSSALRFRPWPDLMTGPDPRSARLHRERLNVDADRAFAIEALARRELVVGQPDGQLQARLTEIFRAARSAQQEGGTNTLFLAIGTLLWRQEGKDRRYRAPIILVPVTLERPSVRSGFSLRAHDDEVRINPTLLEMLRQEFDIRFPTLQGDRPPTDEAGVDVTAILDTFRVRMRDIPGWEVSDEVTLTNLSFTKYLMWKDLSDRADALRESILARRLMDGRVDTDAERNSIGLTGPDSRDAGATLDLDEAAASLVCPFEADSSQLRAVALARRGDTFVMIGPPGTGKSQTIANIIADTLSQGKTVLFVAEKRAALEVVLRHMARIKLADFCLDLFSPKSNKAHVIEQMSRAQQASEDFDPAHWHTASADIAELKAELNGYVRELHRRGRNGWTPFRAMGLVLHAEGGGVPDINLPWADADAHDDAAYQRLVNLIEEAAAVLIRVGDITAASALSGVETSEWSPPWQNRLLEASGLLSVRLKALSLAANAARRALGMTVGTDLSRPALAALRTLADVLLDPLMRQAAWAVREDTDAVMTALRPHMENAERHRIVEGTLAAKWRHAEAMSLPLPEIGTQWTAAKSRRFFGRAVARRRVRRRLASVLDGRKMPKDLGVELSRLIEMQVLEKAFTDANAKMAAMLGTRWAGMATDFMAIKAHCECAGRLRAATAACARDVDGLLALRARLKNLVGEGADLLMPEAAIGSSLVSLRSAMLDVREASTTLAALCGSDPLTIVDGASADWADALAAHLDAWRAQARHLRDWCAWRGLVQRADAVGVGGLLRAMEDGLMLPAEASRVFEVNYARWWIGLAVHGSVRLKSFVAAQHELQIQRFRDLDSKLLGLAAKLTRATLASAIPGQALRERDPEYGVLARELAKRQRHLPVRQLAERMPTALRRLMPCLMMSPMSVAQYLPADAQPFDLVIFDEASQIPTWDAIGVIGRGRQVIIVGDPKQLPPTRFFERQVPGGDGQVGVGQTGDGQVGGVEIDIEDLESILDECLGAGIPSIDLQWHYRSRHESLIAFSNYRYYGGRLITFPAPRTVDRAVSFRHVTDGVYARAGARTNPAEARALVAEVVSVLRGILAGGTPRSIGVVTFNSEQQGLVENLLDEARREDPRLEPFFSDETLEPVMVKNLEGVQGEERDLMLFSLTYGPDQTGRIAMNFGPLNQGGGERRLNVAITRAREQLIVFGSLRPEHIDLSRSSSIGVSHLKEFLDYAINGARAFARAATGPLGDFESPFETAVAHRLAAKGWVLHPQIGVSGFRIDLGVVDPDAPGNFLAGLECDGATYHSGATARDRDRLRQLVLERLGWRILRIWSTDWWTNAERECERLHAALEAALAERRAARTDAGQPGTPGASEPVMDALLLPGVDGGEDASHIIVHSGPLDQEDDAVPHDLAEAGAGATGDDAGMPTVDAARFYDDAYRDTLRAIVISELARSGPLRIDRLAQRVARRHGFLRTGREIQDRVSAAIPEACQRTPDLPGTFVWPIGVDPAAVRAFRELALGQQIDPADLPIEELTALARDCAARFPDQAAALAAMRDACGLAKLREASRERFLEALGRT